MSDELRFSGHSDDLACIDGNINGEIQAIDRHVRFTIGWPEATAGQSARGIVLTLAYAGSTNATWAAILEQIDEEVLCPWHVVVSTPPDKSGPGRPYSVTVTVACPFGTPVLVERCKTGCDAWERYGAWDEMGTWAAESQ